MKCDMRGVIGLGGWFSAILQGMHVHYGMVCDFVTSELFALAVVGAGVLHEN